MDTEPNRHTQADILWNVAAINRTFEEASPRAITLWALSLGLPSMVTTSFGEHSAATLHVVRSLTDRVPAVWVDTGFVPGATHDFARRVSAQLDLDLRVFRSGQSTTAILHRVGASSTETMTAIQRDQFATLVKVEPFQRALASLQPKIWITGIRSEETEYRRSLAPATLDPRGILKIAPFFNSSRTDIEAYLAEHGLPANRNHNDPTKAAPHLECGLHRQPMRSVG